MTAGRAWAALIATITCYEVWAIRRSPEQLLTRGVRRARSRNELCKVAVNVTIAATFLHLLDVLGKADPFRLLEVLR